MNVCGRPRIRRRCARALRAHAPTRSRRSRHRGATQSKAAIDAYAAAAVIDNVWRCTISNLRSCHVASRRLSRRAQHVTIVGCENRRLSPSATQNRANQLSNRRVSSRINTRKKEMNRSHVRRARAQSNNDRIDARAAATSRERRSMWPAVVVYAPCESTAVKTPTHGDDVGASWRGFYCGSSGDGGDATAAADVSNEVALARSTS